MSSVTADKAKKAKRLLWFGLPLLIFAGLVVMLLLRLGESPTIVPSRAVDRAVPEFNLPVLPDLDHSSTPADLPKTPFLMNIWGSWCPTCIIEHPYLMQLHKQGIPIVGINYKDEPANALSYLEQHGNPFVLSIQDLSGEFALNLGLMGAPETFVVDGTGRIRQHIIGEINDENWQDRIKPCFAALSAKVTDDEIKQVCQ